MLVIVGRQLGLVSPRCKLVLLVPVRGSPPDLDVDVALAGHRLVVGCKHEQQGEEDGACREDSLQVFMS